jgi:hypothetical protein
MEQETLEEAAENYEKIHGGSYSIGVGKAFKFGAEWQQQNSYSEEEVIAIVEKSRATGLTAEYLIEQSKKK